MNRQQLYALVWSKPMRTAAAERGISDVALAKQCRRADVPVPPRGYWNKVHAGKAVRAVPLPPTPMERAGLGGLFPARAAPADGVQAGSEDEPPRPTFLDMDTVKERIAAAVGKVTAPARLDHPHPLVARLLDEEAKRQAARPRGQDPYYDTFGVNLSTPIQQRRLRVLSALLSALARLGAAVDGRTQAGERFAVGIGGSVLNVLLAVENGPRGDPFYRGRGARRREGQRLRLDMVGYHPDAEPPLLSWADGDAQLERQLATVVQSLLGHAEERARAEVLRRYDYQVSERARLAREAVLAAERAEKERIAREEAAARARLAALVDGADAFERAERIRRYVATVRGRWADLPGEVDAAALERWSAWALAEADALDPVLSGRILADLAVHGGTAPA